LLDVLNRIQQERGCSVGPQTSGSVLGVSRVENDPTKRSFDYMIAIEAPADCKSGDLECFQVPAARWAVFECRGQVPDSIVASEIYAFSKWLPDSEYQHAHAPEMEVYPASGDENYCEFWLPIEPKETI
jgi:AraC family transcriptional regulator